MSVEPQARLGSITAIHRGLCGNCWKPVEYRVFHNGADWIHTDTENPVSADHNCPCGAHSHRLDIRGTDGQPWSNRRALILAQFRSENIGRSSYFAGLSVRLGMTRLGIKVT